MLLLLLIYYICIIYYRIINGEGAGARFILPINWELLMIIIIIIIMLFLLLICYICIIHYHIIKGEGAGARFILPINWEQPPPRCDGYLTISRPVLHLSIQQSIHTSWLYPSTKDNWKILSPKTLNLCISQNRLVFECFLFAF